ncbi:MAG: hypothetical protein COX65_00160 [Elusimicrobia bacterium CG_4_10_14_0_2_um_filter_56_8]|nr:MAG: hypothetical protein COX65_00160 [Elusimicrobia bacterium CG_4_10_14_0_2_um_filter_56_8]
MKKYRCLKNLPLAAGLLAASFFCGVPARAGQELERAHEAAARGSESRAFDIAMEGLKTAPDDRELFLYAVELLPDRSPGRAGALASAAAARLAGKPEDYAGYLGLCKAMRISGKAAEAVANCRKALETDPTAYPVYRELGLTYAAAGNPRKAAETLAQGVEISSSSYQAHYHLAKVLEKRGDSTRAAASYSSGLALLKNKTSLDAGYYRAMMKAGLKRTSVKKRTARARIPKPAPHRENKELAAACMIKFRGEFLNDNLGTALAASDTCLDYAPSDPDLAAERAPLMVRLGKYEEGVAEYERAASLYSGNRPASAFCRIKAAETWIKLGKQDNALAQYRLALKAAPQDMNALEGLAAALEARSDPAGSLEIYEEILRLEPGNKRARTRKEEIKVATLTSEQILSELKLRNALEGKRTGLLPEDRKLYKAIKAAEISGAVDYLKKKVRYSRGLIIAHKTEDGTRLLLSGAGYRAYVSRVSREAVKFFETEGIGLREIFKLRTPAGEQIFDKAGKLTAEGEELWRKSVPGTKNWLLPYEPVPASPLAIQADKDISEAEKMGYKEISEPEYLWLLRYTDCPEDLMRTSPLNMKTANDGIRLRYLLCSVMNAPCMNQINMSMPLAIDDYRNNKTDIPDTKTSTSFFGTGGIKKHRLCEDGKVWGYEK